jgi:excisionase family DNA binding protein
VWTILSLTKQYYKDYLRLHGDKEGSTMEALTTGEAARLLACSPSALYKLVARRKIPFRKQGKKIVFLRSELEQYLNQLPGYRLEDVLG